VQSIVRNHGGRGAVWIKLGRKYVD
jgi:DNA-nicking Smr family endonuclease